MPTDETSDNLWPKDLINRAVEAPIAILKEQGLALQKLTKNVLKAEPRAMRVPDASGSGASRLIISFVVVAPALDDYEVELLSFEQPETLYPIKAPSFLGTRPLGPMTIAHALAFRNHLRVCLANPKVKDLISSLVAQSKAIG